jgi:hypothetical protein
MNTIEFRLGFAERLAERGIAPSTLGAAMMSKDALFGLSELGSAATSGAKMLMQGSTATYLLAPALIMGIAGYLAAKGDRVSKQDIAAKKELILARDMEESRRHLAERQPHNV